MTRHAMKFLTVALLGLMVACSDDPSGDSLAAPTSERGVFAVHVTSPFSNDGAVSIEIRGEGITDVQGVGSTEIYTTEGTGFMRVAVIGAGLDGDLVTFQVPDAGLAAEYTATVLEVADEANEVRRDLTGYTVMVSLKD